MPSPLSHSRNPTSRLESRRSWRVSPPTRQKAEELNRQLTAEIERLRARLEGGG
ncbi:MAG TPA: hypothetical protein VGG06_36510 [Thermoanaerobaculia bacterium]|jgi:hypothetical protein